MTRPSVMAVALALAASGALSGASSFRAKTADRYPTRQKQGNLIVAVKAFVSEKDQKSAFGKVRPFQHGVTPVLLVMSNRGTDTYSLEKLQVRLITADRDSLDPIRGEDLASLNPSGHQPTRRNIPGVPGLSRTRVKKGPLNRPEITESAFLAPIVTPKSTASGFLYYLVTDRALVEGSSVYISGVYDISNGRDLFYFEIPLTKKR